MKRTPYRVRMFAEVGCDFALWGDPFRPFPPTGEFEEERVTGELEHLLPITPDLRDRILAWADRFYRSDGGDRSIDMSDFDERGMLLSRELQRELGAGYTVQYGFLFADSRKRMLPLVAADPCPGWRAR